MDWQPIETAPKDGTSLLLIAATYRNPVPMIGHWGQNNAWDEEYHWLLGETDDWPTKRASKFRKRAAAEMLGIISTPTHWMPLPPPPKEQPHD